MTNLGRAWGLTWNFIQHLLLWKYRLKMRTFVELERIIWRTSKVFVFGNPYNTVLAMKPESSPDGLACRTPLAVDEFKKPVDFGDARCGGLD